LGTVWEENTAQTFDLGVNIDKLFRQYFNQKKFFKKFSDLAVVILIALKRGKSTAQYMGHFVKTQHCLNSFPFLV
jgi:hypothetical protein